MKDVSSDGKVLGKKYRVIFLIYLTNTTKMSRFFLLIQDSQETEWWSTNSKGRRNERCSDGGSLYLDLLPRWEGGGKRKRRKFHKYPDSRALTSCTKQVEMVSIRSWVVSGSPFPCWEVGGRRKSVSQISGWGGLRPRPSEETTHSMHRFLATCTHTLERTHTHIHIYTE